jgi:hypothetical protein
MTTIAPSWYVVCTFTTSRTVGGEAVVQPASVAHAKAVGGVLTACGLNASTWQRLFHLSFPARYAENCRACLDVVARPGAR